MIDDMGYDGDDLMTNYLDKFGANSHNHMMDIAYNTIINDLTGVINSLTSVSTKINGINYVLSFFEKKEEYEKCVELKKIIEILQNE